MIFHEIVLWKYEGPKIPHTTRYLRFVKSIYTPAIGTFIKPNVQKWPSIALLRHFYKNLCKTLKILGTPIQTSDHLFLTIDAFFFP